jgi:hypothetical protein
LDLRISNFDIGVDDVDISCPVLLSKPKKNELSFIFRHVSIRLPCPAVIANGIIVYLFSKAIKKIMSSFSFWRWKIIYSGKFA